MFLQPLFAAYFRGNLVRQILIGLVLGIAFGLFLPQAAQNSAIIGTFFTGALKAIAPVLVFVLIVSAIAQHQSGTKVHIKPILFLYIFGTFAAALVAVLASFAFPTTLTLTESQVTQNAPAGIAQVLRTLFLNLIDNPVNALLSANYIGILSWAILLGLGLRHANNGTKSVLSDAAQAVTNVVRWVIRLAPLGIFSLVATTIATTGLGELRAYGQLLLILVGSMLVVALVLNPLIVFLKIRRNPYPLVIRCLTESGVTAFFTRSSAANVPVNLLLCKKLGLHEDTYSVSIPLGATINMAGAAITISVLTLAAVHTLNIPVDLPTAVLLSLLATVGACGASGVPGGSLLLIPMACSLFGISNDVAAQVITVGFIISVVQDSCETALNSSTDVLFTAAADLAASETQAGSRKAVI